MLCGLYKRYPWPKTRTEIPTARFFACFVDIDLTLNAMIRGSIVASIPACHAGDPGSIPGRGVFMSEESCSVAVIGDISCQEHEQKLARRAYFLLFKHALDVECHHPW